MPVLLLAQGDVSAKNMLKHAIKTRYGTRPPLMESIRIHFRGRVNVKIGPVSTFVPVDVTALFRFPNAMRWDFIIRPPGLSSHRLIESTDGRYFYFTPDNRAPRIVTDSQQTHSMVRRMWAMASTLLTPLSDMNVQLTETSARSFKAAHLRYNDSTHLYFDADHHLERVQVYCMNPANTHQQPYTITSSKTMTVIDNFTMPTKMRVYWNTTPFFEIVPYAVERDIYIPDSIFRVAYEGNTISTAQASVLR